MQEIIDKAKDYFFLQYNEKINEPSCKNYVCLVAIENKSYEVYFSNKSLKHFVESRKESFLKNHNEEYTLDKIIEMLNVLIFSIENLDSLKYSNNRENRIEIKKDLRHLNMRSVRVIFERFEKHLEVVSYHPNS